MSSIYVITGGRGCGMTTLCSALSDIGYVVLPDVARKLISENEKSGSGPLPWTDFEGFQRAVMLKQKKRESFAAGLDEIIFANKGLSDTLAHYLARGENKIPLDIVIDAQRNGYAGVFILDPLPNYRIDAQRKEIFEYARKIHDNTLGAYQISGHQPFFVPVMSTQDRVKYVLDKIEEVYDIAETVA